MQFRFLIHFGWLALAAGLVAAGCDAWKGTEEVAEEAVPSAPALPVTSIGSPRREEKLTLNLKVGDRFPLLKTVEQSLRQPSPQGITTSRSSLELLMIVSVEEVRQPEAGQGNPNGPPLRRLKVKYQRVRFAQELPGGEGNLQYSSDAPPDRIPIEALGYHGLKDNSFEFWLGQDHQILQIIDFDKFLARCLQGVPARQQVQVRTFLASTSGAEGISNFIDDSIGLLPTHAVKVNETWSRERTIPQPVPMHISNRYTLRQLNANVAEVDIYGMITPSATYGPPNQPNKEIKLFVTGGECYGSCTIDRRTGLPIQSRVEQSMKMNVKLPGGIDFQQQKNTAITIRAFPGQTAQAVAEKNTAPVRN